jgi:hypothetical protein
MLNALVSAAAFASALAASEGPSAAGSGDVGLQC